MTARAERGEVVIVATGEMPGPPLDRAVALAHRFAEEGPTVLLAPAHAPNHRLRAAAAPAQLELLRPGRLEGVRKWDWLRRRRPAVIYCVGGWFRNLVPAMLARPFTGSKVVADFDEVMSVWPSRKRWLYRLLERLVIPRLDALVVVSGAMEAWAIGIGVPPDRILKVPFAADTQAIARIAAQADAARPGRAPVEIGYLGSLTPHYDFWYLVDAMEAVLGRWPDAMLHLIGDGAARAMLEERVAARGLRDRIAFHGFLALPFPGVPEPPVEAVRCLAQCDVLLFPIQDTEINRLRCPQKSYVYLATGTPIATCAVGEVPEACGDFATYFDMAHPASLIAALEEAMSEAPGRRGQRRAFAADAHSWESRSRDCWVQLARVIFGAPS